MTGDEEALRQEVERLMGQLAKVNARCDSLGMSLRDVIRERDAALLKAVQPRPWGFADLMATAALRYCLGSRTYIVGACVEWLIEQWPNFEPNCRAVIQRDVEEQFKRDDLARARGEDYKPLGWDCDRADWERARKLWQEPST